MLRDMPDRFAHVAGVAKSANDAAARRNIKKRDELVAAAWLHDIGYAKSIAFTGFHPLDGARFLEADGFDPLIVSLVAYHSEAIVEAGERDVQSQLLKVAYPPKQLLDFLTFADMTTGPRGETVRFDDRIDEILTRYKPNDPVFRAVTRSKTELRAIVGRMQ